MTADITDDDRPDERHEFWPSGDQQKMATQGGCTCVETRPQTWIQPAEVEQDPYCSLHPSIAIVLGTLDNAIAEVARLRAALPEQPDDDGRLVARLREIHTPYTEEAEFYCFADGTDNNWGCESYDECPGHEIPIEVCSECGHTYEDDRIMYRRWPCPTIKALPAPAEPPVTQPEPEPVVAQDAYQQWAREQAPAAAPVTQRGMLQRIAEEIGASPVCPTCGWASAVCGHVVSGDPSYASPPPEPDPSPSTSPDAFVVKPASNETFAVIASSTGATLKVFHDVWRAASVADDLNRERHLRDHTPDGRWHDGCPYCRWRRIYGFRCHGGWIPSGDWWLHCSICRPDPAAGEVRNDG